MTPFLGNLASLLLQEWFDVSRLGFYLFSSSPCVSLRTGRRRLLDARRRAISARMPA